MGPITKPFRTVPAATEPTRPDDNEVVATAKKLGSGGVLGLRDAFELHSQVTRDGAVSSSERAGLQVLLTNASFSLTPEGRSVLAPLAPSLEPEQALALVTASSSWAELSAAQQSQVTAMLSGRTNALSAAARATLADTLTNPSWARLSAQGQAARLTGLLNLGLGGASRVAAPPIPDGPTPYQRVGQVDVASFQFPNGETQAATRLTLDIGGHRVDIVSPSPAVGDAGWTPSVDEIARSLSALPAEVLAQMKLVRLSPTAHPMGPGTTMSASGDGVINMYPQPVETIDWCRHIFVATLFHEAAHTVSLAQWGSDPAGPAWQTWSTAEKADGTSVSSYANTNALEDLAETAVVFLAARGTPAFNEYRAIFPERWKLLEQLLSEKR